MTTPRWYMVNKMGMATLCASKADAEKEAADAQSVWPHMGPHRAVQLVEAADVEAMRAGYAAARLEIESLQARIKTMAEEHADELTVAHLNGRMRAAQPAGAQQPDDCGNTPYDEGPFTLEQRPVTAYAGLPDVDALAQEIRRVDGGHDLGAGALAEALMPFLRASHGQAPAQAAPQREAASVDLKTMELAESVGLIGPASRTHDLHAAIQRFHDLICANATIKAAQMAAEAISESAPQADSQPAPVRGESAAPKLRAMAINYPEGACWDKLDAQTCMEGALEIEALRAARAPADSVTAPVGERENLDLRRMLCVAHAGAAAYMDDGEAQDNRDLPLIDFLRDTPAEIQDKLQRRALKKLAAAPTPPAQTADSVLEDAAPTWRCQHCIDRHDGIYGSWAAPCPYHDDDGKLRIDAARAAQEGKSHG